MSTTALKRPLAEAQADAEAFRALFPPDSYERWTIAGSVRRGKPECGDVDHVVIPAFGPVSIGGGLFGQVAEGNRLWACCDELLASGQIEKQIVDVHRRGGTVDRQTRWGEIMRCISYRGQQHQIFTASADNFGSQLVIRTGPAEFSERMVTLLHPRGLEHANGRIRYKRTGATYATPTEESFFIACGVPWIEPAKRM